MGGRVRDVTELALAGAMLYGALIPGGPLALRVIYGLGGSIAAFDALSGWREEDAAP